MKQLLKILACLCLAVLTAACSSATRTIETVEPIAVETPEGTVPRLPYLVWVTYSDGHAEWRQTRWTNAALTTEQEQADATMNPAGTTYQVAGYITGDNTTPNGYPITAQVKVVSGNFAAPSHMPVAEPLPLDQVTIEGDNRLTSNRDLLIETVLSWDITQQLYNYRDTYGLSTEGYTISDGWDSPTTKLKGHGSGHYMSSLAFAFASAVKQEHKDALRDRIRRMVDELRLCQERTFVWNPRLGRYHEARDFAPEHQLRTMQGTWQAFDQHKREYASYGYGYLNAIPAHHAVLIEMYRAYNNEQWVWAPYYSIHKQLAGLIDIANYVDDQEIADKALLIAKDMGLWIWNRMHYRTHVKADGTKEERRARPGNRYEMWDMYIAGEVGGVGESLARLSQMVSDSTEKARLLEASNCFDAPAFYEPLSRNIDDIRTRHANQHIPMIVAALQSYRANANPYYYNIAQNFWTLIQGRYAYATGGVGNGEMWRQPYTQMLSMNTNVTSYHSADLTPAPTINETCCAYNLAKLTKDLNCFNPDDARYMDYYERVLYNQLVGSVHPHHYMTTYQYAVGMDASKPWGNETPQATCCGGTGSENHVKYQEAAYFVSDKALWVALYLPTTFTWQAKNIKMQQNCKWPAESSQISVLEGEATFAMKLRVPYWATQGFDVKLNGQSVAREYRPSSYVEIPERTWRPGDVVEISMPFGVHINYGPDKMETAATGVNQTNTPFAPMWVGTLMYGPLAMATTDAQNWDEATVTLDADLGNVRPRRATDETGTEGNLYTLTLDGKTFYPDYYLDEHITHYLRINLEGTALQAAGSTSVDKTALAELFRLVERRKAEQEAWLAMEQKVPDYAPWAPHGYARLMAEYEKALDINRRDDATQPEVNAICSALNVAINTMRPGNLPELEDLEPLLPLLQQAQKADNPTAREAIEYAQMVVSYVSDGSGTMDMIQKAIKQLEEIE